MSRFNARSLVMTVLLIIISTVIIGRLIQIQLVRGGHYAEMSDLQTRQREVVKARRGVICDRNGVPLATSVSRHIDMDTLRATSGGKSKTSGGSRRIYPYGEIGASVIGYVGDDGYGLGGIEFSFERYLRGEDGWTFMQRDGRNNRSRRVDLPQKLPVNGCDVQLTLDLEVQKIVEKILKQTVDSLGAKSGMCIVMDPHTGEIIAMASAPGFDPNFALSETKGLRSNSCISFNYEPGSTFKLITAAAALECGSFSEHDIIDGGNGRYEVFNQIIRDHRAHGLLTFTQALAVSSNVCFAKIANGIGNDRLYQCAKDFGIGNKTGIELPGEEGGIVHPVEKWSGRTRVTMAIGQEVSATLLQMTTAFSCIANDGVLVSPRIYRRVIDASGNIVTSADSAHIIRQTVSAKTAVRLRHMLESVVDSGGTGVKAAVAGVAIAGKTGTAQKIDENTGSYSMRKSWASFIGLIPSDKPVLVCGIVIDEPKDNAVGGDAAAPAFNQIVTQVLSHPTLAYAEKILGENSHPVLVAVTQKKYPDFRGMSLEKAERILSNKHIEFETVGAGNMIAYQSPSPGTIDDGRGHVVLFTRDTTAVKNIGNLVSVPECMGKDIKSAINVLNLKGFAPYVIGAGFVTRQSPTGGNFITPNATCTLFCRLDG